MKEHAFARAAGAGVTFKSSKKCPTKNQPVVQLDAKRDDDVDETTRANAHPALGYAALSLGAQCTRSHPSPNLQVARLS